MAAKFIMHAAKAIVAGERHCFLHLFDVKHFDRMVQPFVSFGNEAILLPLPFSHCNQDAAFLMLSRVTQEFVHLGPQALFFIEQRAGIMRCATTIAP